MGSEQFSQAVRGSGAEPISVSNLGSLDTNDYPNGDAGIEDGSAYPYDINPAEEIKEFGLTLVGGTVDVQIVTTGGDTFTLRVDSPGFFDRWDIDSVQLQDPNANSPNVSWTWAGE